LTLADITRNLRDRPSMPHSGVALLTTQHQQRTQPQALISSAEADLSPEVQRQKEKTAASVVRQLQAMSYVKAVLWLGEKLADGLAHAHERGIQHRDLKPANVLITDEGVPMLLDFNLAEDTKVRDSASAAAVGGTLPYMAPEQIKAFCGGASAVDA